MTSSTPPSFEWRRFRPLLRLMWAAQPRLPYAAPLLASAAAWFALADPRALTFGYHTADQNLQTVFNIALAASCSLYAGHLFGEFARPADARRFLQLPAAVLEKWLAKMTLALLVFPLFAFAAQWALFELIRAAILRAFAFRYAAITFSSVWAALPFVYACIAAAIAAGQAIRRFGFFIALAAAALFAVAVAQAAAWANAGVPLGAVALHQALWQNRSLLPAFQGWATLCRLLLTLSTAGFLAGSFLHLRHKEA